MDLRQQVFLGPVVLYDGGIKEIIKNVDHQPIDAAKKRAANRITPKSNSVYNQRTNSKFYFKG
jgi:hypothetical protein